MKRWTLRIEDPKALERYAGESIYHELRRVAAERENLKRLQRLNRLFPILDGFKLEPDVYRSQNLYFEISLENRDRQPGELSKEWLDQFLILGSNLGVKVEG